MKHFHLGIALALFACGMLPAIADPTPPIMPRVQETPLPPAVELPAPATLPADLPNRPLTAEEAAQIALHTQPSVTIAQLGVIAAQGRRQQAKSGLLPTVGASAGYTSVFDGTSAPAGLGSEGYNVSASIKQLLFDFSHTRYVVQQSVALERAATANLTKVQSDLVLQVKQAFYQYVQNQHLVTVNEANVRSTQEHLNVAQARVKAGVGLPVDVVRAETSVADAIFSLNLARNTASISRVNLALFMGIDPRTPLQTAETDEPEIAADNPEALVKTALQQRPEVLQAQATIQASQQGVGAARTSNAPALVGIAGVGQHGTNFPPDQPASGIGVAVQWNPFDSGLSAGRVQEAKANLLAAQQQLIAANLAIVSDVSQSYINLKTAEQRVVTADAEVANAQEALRLAQGRYQAGLGVFLDVLDAQTALLTAQTNRINTQASVNQARASLAHAINSRFATPQPAVK
ncbi:MAG TPA: TolC family protein [Armatimonadota bacterium]|jgi:outer membrane protein TolC